MKNGGIKSKLVKELDLRSGVDVANVGGNTRHSGDIIESEGGDERIQLHKKRERLADPPAAPRTATFHSCKGADAKARLEDALAELALLRRRDLNRAAVIVLL